MSDLAERIRRRLANEAEGNVYLDISWVMAVIAEEDARPSYSKHPYTCEWCDGEWFDYNLYDMHFNDLTHKNPDHPYLNPVKP